MVLINKFVLVGTLKRRFIVWSKTGFFGLMNHHETFVKKQQQQQQNPETKVLCMFDWCKTTSGSLGYLNNSHSCQDKHCDCRGYYYCTTIKKLMFLCLCELEWSRRMNAIMFC